jgi:chromosome segregation ATPase
MILECAGCAKMYRVRDEASPQPSKCPTCNGELRAAGGGAQAGSPGRVRELETKIQTLERELAETRSGRPTLSVETSPGNSGFSAPVAELRAAAEKSDRLERELLSLRSDMERKLKEKDREIAESRETSDREAAERRKLEARASGLEETHARGLDGKEKTIQALDASIASYRGKVEALQKKLDSVEIQRLSDLNQFDTRIREREQSDRDQLDRATQTQQEAIAALRNETESKIAEKDRLISDGRQALDREAGERRRLSETLKRLQENADRAVAEKAAAISALETMLASYKTKIDTLQSRVDSLEQMRRSEHDQFAKQVRTSQAIRGRVDEASHLATDLDHSLDSIEASIATLRDRARRLKGTLQETGSEAEAVPSFATLSSSFAPPPEPEIESVQPALSQADWTAPAAVEPEPALEALPPEEEQAGFSEVTRTQIKMRTEPEPELIVEPIPISEPAPADLPSEALAKEGPEEFQGRSEAPSGVIPIADPAAQAAAAPAPDETAFDIPLISPPEEEKPASAKAAEDKTAGAAPAGAPAKKEETKRKFSWQRK